MVRYEEARFGVAEVLEVLARVGGQFGLCVRKEVHAERLSQHLDGLGFVASCRVGEALGLDLGDDAVNGAALFAQEHLCVLGDCVGYERLGREGVKLI